MRFRWLAALLAAGLPLAAQEVYPHHNFSFNIGAATPKGEIKSFTSTAPLIGFSYGYRFMKYFQADAGLNLFFGAANTTGFVPTQAGTFQLKDREYLIPLGGRAILPLMGGRLLISGGGGAAWLRYSERVNTGNLGYYGYSIACPNCTSRSGWGSYGLVGASYFLDHDQHFRVGLNTMLVRAKTSGAAVGDLPGITTNDHWLNIAGEFGFSF